MPNSPTTTAVIGAQQFAQDALTKIELMRGRALPDIVAPELVKMFDGAGRYKTAAVLNRLRSYESIPQNIIGCCEKILWELNNQQETEGYKYKDRNDFGDKKTLESLAIFLVELEFWHKNGLAEYNHKGLTTGIDINQWIEAGRPKTWSPILDHWLNGFVKAHEEEKINPGAILAFEMEYNTMLIAERIKRMAEKEAKNEQSTIPSA
jgi:hypothetical protein